MPVHKVGRKTSLMQAQENQPLSKGKRQKLSNYTFSTLATRSQNRKNNLLENEWPDSDCRGQGDNIRNTVQIVCPAFGQQFDTSSEHQKFPFKNTPSGNYKVKPDQVVYESKNLGIIAANPDNITLNMAESGEAVVTEAGKKAANDNWTTTYLFTAADTEGKMPFGSDFSDTISESDYGGPFTGRTSAAKQAELSLAKMGYVTDNCIDWKIVSLPNKSELQKLLLHNILNMINPDIQVKIGSSTYNCHRIVLQSYCTYFSTKVGPKVDLPEDKVPKEIFTLIYQWMLYQSPESYKLLRRDNILAIFKVAQFLGVKELENQCWAFIDNVELFCEDKAFLLYLQARQHSNQDIMELMVPRVQRFFLTLVSSKEFVDLSVKEVCTFLRSNYICVHSEVEVFMAAVRWLNHDWQARKQYVTELMKCVRFAFIDPRTLITIKRSPKSPEFQRIANFPEVSQMIDDGISLSVLKTCLKGDSDEDLQTSLNMLGLTDPAPRNWAGTVRNYKSYHEFLQDLAQYRSKQRLEIRKSKMKIQMNKIEDGDFLSSAVLLPETQQKIKTLHDKKGPSCLSLEELNILKKIICQDERTPEDRTRQMRSKLCSMAEEKYRRKECVKPSEEEKYKWKECVKPKEEEMYRRKECVRPSEEEKYKRKECVKLSEEEMYRRKERVRPRQNPDKVIQKRAANELEREAAARTIQKAYRGYARKTGTSTEQSSSYQTSRMWKSRSEPSLVSGLLTSSTYPAEKCNEDSLLLPPGQETVFVFGGGDPFRDDQNISVQKIYRYEIKSNIWKKCGDLPEPCHYHSAVYFQGKIYIAGGKTPTKDMNGQEEIKRKVWCYDPKFKTWSRVCDMLYTRYTFGFVVSNNKIFAIGGRGEQDRILDSVETYDLQTDSWVEVRAMNMARAGCAACNFNGCIWVAGGQVDTDSTVTNTVEYYSHNHNMWIQFSVLRYYTCYGVLLNVGSHLYMIGGAIGLHEKEQCGSGKQIDTWDHESQTWCLASMMNKPKHAHAAVYLSNASSSSEPGQVFIIGGLQTKYQRTIKTVECWHADDDEWVLGTAPFPHPVSGLAALALPVHTFD